MSTTRIQATKSQRRYELRVGRMPPKGDCMSDMNCPYCDAKNEVCHDDGDGYDESQRHEHTCRECRKSFVFTTEISYHYEPHKAECLNDGEHQLALSRTFPKRYSMMRCNDCDYERTPTEQELGETA